MDAIRRLRRRWRDFVFPVRCGLGPLRIDEVLAAHPDLDIRYANWDKDPGAGSFWDLTTIACLVRAVAPARAFEIGTGHGRATAQIAANSPGDAIVYTLDLSDGPQIGSVLAAVPEAAGKVTRLSGDSMRVDFSPYARSIDFVLVDGGHDFVPVASDTAAAFAMVSPRGVILWHDFNPDWPGVVRALNHSPHRNSIRRLLGTSYAFYGAPGSIHATGPIATGPMAGGPIAGGLIGGGPSAGGPSAVPGR